MNRFNNIKDKLEYAESLRQQLFDVIFKSHKEKVETKKIIFFSSTTLSECRECFDYCFYDIFEKFVLPFTNINKLIIKNKVGQIKLYFPIFEKQFVTNNGSYLKIILDELNKYNPNLYKYLYDLTKKIENNYDVINTGYKYGTILELINMVNQKKHNKLLAIKNESNQNLFIENHGFKVVFPLKNSSIKTFEVPKNSIVELIDEFIFEYNNINILDFCMHVVLTSKIILNEIYKNYFGRNLID